MKHKTQQPLSLTVPTQELRDAVAGGPNHAKHRKLALNPGNDDQLRDALAESPAIPTGAPFAGSNHAPQPPRGGGEGGIGFIHGPNRLINTGNPTTPEISPSGPPTYNPQ
ncbi:MAG: hypothetical protein WC881_12175 [Elusimicrobiota bacterium]